MNQFHLSPLQSMILGSLKEFDILGCFFVMLNLREVFKNLLSMESYKYTYPGS